MEVEEIRLIRIVYSEVEPKATVYFRIHGKEGATLDVSGTVDSINQEGNRVEPSLIVGVAASRIDAFLQNAGARLFNRSYQWIDGVDWLLRPTGNSCQLRWGWPPACLAGLGSFVQDVHGRADTNVIESARNAYEQMG